jgi:hypothetical protein
MNISGLVPHRATVGLAVATVARATGDTTRLCAGANARKRSVATTRIAGQGKYEEARNFAVPGMQHATEGRTESTEGRTVQRKEGRTPLGADLGSRPV